MVGMELAQKQEGFMKKRTLLLILTVILLVLSLGLAACNGDDDEGGDGNGDAPRTDLPSANEMALVGLSDFESIGVPNGLTVTQVVVSPEDTADYDKGVYVCYSGGTADTFAALVEQVYTNLAHQDETLSDVPKTDLLYADKIFVGYYAANGKTYEVGITLHTEDVVKDGKTMIAAGSVTLLICEYQPQSEGDGSGTIPGGNPTGPVSTAWPSAAEFAAYGAGAIAKPDAFTVASKTEATAETDATLALIGVDKQLTITLQGTVSFDALTAFAQTLYQDGFAQNYNLQNSAFADLMVSADPYFCFSGYRTATNSTYLASVECQSGVTVICFQYTDTTPPPIRTAFITAEELANYQLPALTAPQGTLVMADSYTYAGVAEQLHFYFTGVNAAQFATYAEQELYGTRGANRDYNYRPTTFALNVNGSTQSFAGYYAQIDVAGAENTRAYQYYFELEYYGEEDVARLGGNMTYRVAANSMILRVSKLLHQHDMEQTTVLPTCKDGYQLTACADCSKEVRTDATTATGHIDRNGDSECDGCYGNMTAARTALPSAKMWELCAFPDASYLMMYLSAYSTQVTEVTTYHTSLDTRIDIALSDMQQFDFTQLSTHFFEDLGVTYYENGDGAMVMASTISELTDTGTTYTKFSGYLKDAEGYYRYLEVRYQISGTDANMLSIYTYFAGGEYYNFSSLAGISAVNYDFFALDTFALETLQLQVSGSYSYAYDKTCCAIAVSVPNGMTAEAYLETLAQYFFAKGANRTEDGEAQSAYTALLDGSGGFCGCYGNAESVAPDGSSPFSRCICISNQTTFIGIIFCTTAW